MKQVILILGAFNPITNAHINLGKLARSYLSSADIYYVPARGSFLKKWKLNTKEIILSDIDRLNLVKEAVEKYDFKVIDIEITGISDGRTYNTVDYFKKELGYDTVYIMLGTDKLSELHLWYEAENLVKENKFLIVDRNKFTLSNSMTDFIEKYVNNFIAIKNTEYETVSSTVVRTAYKENRLEDIKEIVPKCVIDFYENRKDTENAN